MSEAIKRRNELYDYLPYRSYRNAKALCEELKDRFNALFSYVKNSTTVVYYDWLAGVKIEVVLEQVGPERVQVKYLVLL